ncbi:hypothetical protein C8R44DRAFT_875594 [Mycena epipterygia]|nr:hypothetical protein C8R44DRAFT_875594 [Mycena epipterygia]
MSNDVVLPGDTRRDPLLKRVCALAPSFKLISLELFVLQPLDDWVSENGHLRLLATRHIRFM